MTKQQEQEIETLTRRAVEARRERDRALSKIMQLEADLVELREIVSPLGGQVFAYRAQLDAIRTLIDHPAHALDAVLVNKIRAILQETPHD